MILLGFSGWSLALENRRAATDKFVGILMWTAFVLAMIPLVSLIYTVVSKGGPVLTPDFLSSDMSGRALLGEGGGIYHAIMGTVMVTAIAGIIAVPIGILTAIYLVEYGHRGAVAPSDHFLRRCHDGHPVDRRRSLCLCILRTPVTRRSRNTEFGPGRGSVALSLLMIPVVVRSSEEIQKLVP